MHRDLLPRFGEQAGTTGVVQNWTVVQSCVVPPRRLRGARLGGNSGESRNGRDGASSVLGIEKCGRHHAHGWPLLAGRSAGQHRARRHFDYLTSFAYPSASTTRSGRAFTIKSQKGVADRAPLSYVAVGNRRLPQAEEVCGSAGKSADVGRQDEVRMRTSSLPADLRAAPALDGSAALLIGA